MPRNSCRDFTVWGRGKLATASTLVGSGTAPCGETGCPRKSMDDRPKWHFAELPEVFQVLLCGCAGHEDVVQVHKQERHVAQHRVHRSPECLRCPFEAKWHPKELEESERRDDRRLGDVPRMDRHLVVAAHQVHFRKNGGSRQVGREILNVRHRVPVRGRVPVGGCVPVGGRGIVLADPRLPS